MTGSFLRAIEVSDRGIAAASCSRAHRGRLKAALVPALVGVVLVSPSLVWVSIDRAIWQWDQSWYGAGSIHLWATLRLTPQAWWSAMLHVFGSKPPAIAWIGQFFVPLGGVLGSTQVALLYSIELTLASSLALLYVSGRRLTKGDAVASLAGVLATASAPLVVGLSHWYLVEPIQSVAVVWALFIMVSASRWHPSLTLAQLTAAIAFGLLAKLSTPLYVAAPAAVALVLSILVSRGRATVRWWSEKSFVASAVFAAALTYATAEWYRLNFDLARQHAQVSATSALWGTVAPFGSKLPFWLNNFRDALALPYFDLALGTLLAAGAAAVGMRRRWNAPHASRYLFLVLAGCAGTPAAVLVLLAAQVNWDPRFLMPAIPAVGLGLVAVLRLLNVRAVTVLVSLLFAGQYTLTALQSFTNAIPAQLPAQLLYRTVPTPRSTMAAELDQVVQLTCTDATAGKFNLVGTSYAWLNANTLGMLAAERFAMIGRRCYYRGFPLALNDPDAGWRDVVRYPSPFFVTVDYDNPGNPLPPELQARHEFLERFNRINIAVLRRAIETGQYVIVPGSRRNGLVVLQLAKEN
jgi:hypothetical protein